VELTVETSARRGDVTRFGPEQMSNRRFEFQHHKNGRRRLVPGVRLSIGLQNFARRTTVGRIAGGNLR
jgi:hypothetical protein